MKQLIILLLSIILAFIVYDFYKDWERFHPPVSQYQKSDKIDLNYHDPSVIMDYYKAVAALDNFVMMQWTANDIDVRNPEDEDSSTLVALEKYSVKKAEVAFYELKLEQSAVYKTQGWSNIEIAHYENSGTSAQDQKQQEQKKLLNKLYDQEFIASQQVGARTTLIFEVQKLLLSHGYQLTTDGVYAQETIVALSDFETKNNLYPDGKIDVLSFSALIK